MNQNTEKITVKVPAAESRSYDIVIGDGLLDAKLLGDLAGEKRVFIVSDENVKAAGHLSWLDGQESFIIAPAGEQSKTIHTALAIVEQMERSTYGRDSVIIAIGGGTVGDIAGFAAAIFKRGIDVIHLPTTTVSQADSSIGGKTGVDSTLSKNAYGCFWHPKAVVIDVATLLTLEQRQYLSGLVESLKHALIADEGYFDYMEANLEALLNRDKKVLARIAGYNCRIKASVAEQDPTEKNQRRILNYGHTIGHAVETLSDYSLYHGECVAIGIVGASLIEQKLGIGSKQRTEAIKKLLKALKQPTTIPTNYTNPQLLNIISHDKKARQGKILFALTEQIGKAYIRDGQWAHSIDSELIAEVLNELREG